MILEVDFALDSHLTSLRLLIVIKNKHADTTRSINFVKFELTWLKLPSSKLRDELGRLMFSGADCPIYTPWIMVCSKMACLTEDCVMNESRLQRGLTFSVSNTPSSSILQQHSELLTSNLAKLRPV